MKYQSCYAAIITLILALSVCACAKQEGSSEFSQEYYPACAAPIMNLPKTPQPPQTFDSGAGNVVFGAISRIISDGFDIVGTTLNTAADIVTGLKNNGAYARNRNIANDNLRMASYEEGLNNEFSSIVRTRDAATQSLACYRQSFQALLAGVKNGSISRTVARTRFAEIASGRDRAIYVLSNLAVIGRGVADDYENALSLESQNTGLRGAYLAEYRNRINAASAKDGEMGMLINEIVTERDQAREESVTMTRQMNEAMAG